MDQFFVTCSYSQVPYILCSMSDVMDLANEEGVVFDVAQWIGWGQTYKDVPIYVCDVLTGICQIPDLVSKSCLPSLEVPILDFINLPLPPQSSELTTCNLFPGKTI